MSNSITGKEILERQRANDLDFKRRLRAWFTKPIGKDLMQKLSGCKNK